MNNLKIVRLQAENIKRLTAVSITPDGNMVQITGKNGQGKTSVLDSIWWALAGAKHIQVNPIRKGAKSAKIRLDLGELVVTRTFEPGEGKVTSSIRVTDKEGGKFGSPQTLLDELLGELTFDPLAFSRMKKREQFDTLRAFAPGVDFDGIHAKNLMSYDNRTEINRRSKEARTRGEAIEVPDVDSIIRIEEDSIIEKLKEAIQFNADIERRSDNRISLYRSIKDREDRAAALVVEADALIEIARVDRKKLEAAGALAEQVNVTAIEMELNDARENNKLATLCQQRHDFFLLAEKYEAESKDITASIAKRNEDSAAQIAKIKLPVESITFGDGEILLDGQPFSQGSDAEQLQASISIAMALNPKLRVIRVRDGSLLDDDSMGLLAELADENDYQIWIERINSSGEVGFILENGKLKGGGDVEEEDF